MLGLPPYDASDNLTRTTAQLRRPLDFTAVTDHAEQFGEIQISALTPGLPGYDSAECVSASRPARGAASDDAHAAAAAAGDPVPARLRRLEPAALSWCGTNNENCLEQASLVWQDTQAAAEQFYDRLPRRAASRPSSATEWSGQPGGNNLHRNVIFRNEKTVDLPISFMEQPTPQGLWTQLHAQCSTPTPAATCSRSRTTRT